METTTGPERLGRHAKATAGIESVNQTPGDMHTRTDTERTMWTHDSKFEEMPENSTSVATPSCQLLSLKEEPT